MVRYKNEKRKSKKVVTKTERGIDADKKKKKSSSKNSISGEFYYSFLTIILLLCLIQIVFSAGLNISKIISYKAKMIQITKTRDEAKELNEQLQDNIKNFSNLAGMEAIARNNLKMSSEDEVLVIISTNKDEEKFEKENIKKVGFIKHD